MNKYFYSDKYLTIEDGGRQYDDIDLSSQNIVTARYVKSKIAFDNGNMFIEALPRPREGTKEIFAAYNKEIGMFTEESKKEMKPYEKLSAISLIRQIRFPLPFHQSLEEEVYMSLLNSYRNRHQITEKSVDGTTEVVKLKGKDSSATSAGFSLLGYSGCGKSSALEILFSNYPRVIMHEIDEYTKIPQIVYLVVNCTANSNFSALYTSIGTAIDNALGYASPVYETIIEKARSLGAKADKVRDLIERFSIGIIIFDEIQLINFASTKENSIEGLMTLANKTKVAMGVIGTEDAFSMMFHKLRTGRRFGESIIGHEYCKNYDYFKFIVNSLFNYQWFDTYVKPTEAMTQTLYKYSKGIIDQVIGIFIFMQLDYIKADKKPIVNEEYIKKVADKHYPGLQQLLSNLEDPVSEARRIQLVKEGNKEISDILFEASQKQKAQADEIMSMAKEDATKENKKALMEIVQSIMDITDEFDMPTIMSVAAKEISLKSNAYATVAELKKKTFNKLKAQKNNSIKQDRANKGLDDLHINMLNDIMD